MKLLALEWSSPRRSVAVADAGKLLAEAVLAPGPGAPFLTGIEQVLAKAGTRREEIEVLAIGLGPGSYTGIRAAIALAQGWELAGGVRLLGLSSTAACALRCQAVGFQGAFAIVFDAQRGEFYVEEYLLGSGPPVTSAPLRLLTREALDQRIADGVRLAGPELKTLGLEGEVVAPDAAAVAELSFGRTQFEPGDRLQPIYLRATSFTKAPPPRFSM